MKTLVERLGELNISDRKQGEVLFQVKAWLQDQYREYILDEGANRKPGICWAASYLGDKTCPRCIGTGIAGGPGSCYEGRGKPCRNCDGKGYWE